jgi:type VI secretion system protein ImpJ
MFEDIDWYNGLLIKPQHMQMFKLTGYFKMFQFNKLFNINLYGILSTDIDCSKIHEGIIKVISIKALNKDGSIIDYNINENYNYKLILNLNDEKNLDKNIDNFTIYLATINYNPKTTENNNRYYKLTYGPIIDNAQSDHDEYVQVLCPKPYLILERDILPKYTVFPFLKLKRIQNVWQVLNFQPPYLAFDQNNDFVKASKLIYINLTKKIDELAVKIIHHKQHQSLDHKIIIDMHNYEIILSSYTRLKYILALDVISPQKLFYILVDLLRAMYFILCTIMKLELQYEHDNMHSCYLIVLNKINEIIVEVLQQDIIFINFEISNDKNLTISLPHEYQPINNYIYCFCSSEKYDKEDIVKLINTLVMYSSSKEEEIKQFRISGIKREVFKQFTDIKELVGLSGIQNAICFRFSLNDVYFNYNDQLIIELDSDKIKDFKFNIILKQN